MVRDVAAARYLKPGESSLEDVYSRTARHVFPDDDGLSSKYAKLMADGWFMPNSPCLMNAGDQWGGLAACYVQPVDDSLSSFMAMLTTATRIFQEGGGVGVNFGRMRPEGSPVRGSDGVASGPVSFIRMFDMLAETIKQGGKRRAAEIALLPISHPDVEKFLEAKYIEGSIKNANLSVRIPDAFMRAAEAGEDWDLTFNGKVYRTVKARALLEKIAHYAWVNGEPGVQFSDTVTRGDTCPHLEGEYDSSNPCVTGDTLVLTRQGDLPIRDLVGREVEVWNGRWWSAVTPRRTGTDQSVIEVTVEGGHRLRCTPYHTMICVKGDPTDLDHLAVIKKPASALVPGDRLLVVSPAGTIGPELFPRSLSIHAVERIADAGVADEVFCFTEPHLNKGVFNGILTGNCGEQYLRTNIQTMGGECCTLGHIGLAKCVVNGAFDFDLLKSAVRDGVRFLDRVIDINVYPTPAIEAMAKETRKIGLGVMGLADALILMGLPYDSPEGITASLDIAQAFDRYATEASQEIADELGCFPAWEGSTWHEKGIRMRNAMVTTVAPTGTTSQFAGTSAGIEPTLIVYQRANTIGGKYFVIHPIFEQRLRTFVYNEMIGIWDEDEQNARFKQVIDHAFRHGSIQDLDWLPDNLRRPFVTSLDVSWQYHLNHLQIWANSIHNGISKTVSLPESATEADVLSIYIDAWKTGVKGVTVYRQGSREDEVYSLKKEQVAPPQIPPDWERPEWLPAWARKTAGGCGTKYVVVTYDSFQGREMPVEVFVPSGEGCHASDEGETRLISKMLQLNVTVAEIDKQLNKVKCPTAMLSQKQGRAAGHSCPDIVGNTLRTVADKFLNGAAPVPQARSLPVQTAPAQRSATCPDCGAKLGFGEGCGKGICRACGWSGCA